MYQQLAEITGSPVVELNRAVAVAQAGDAVRALKLVDRLELDDCQYLHSTRGELLRRLGRIADARERDHDGRAARERQLADSFSLGSPARVIW